MARILVIDDDPSLARALRLGLHASGHEVLVASTGEEGITHSLTGENDVIVLDLGLPDIDGLQVCRQIREWSEVPIIVLSANFAEGRKVAALNEGADDYVTKPFGMAELEARIRTALRHARPEGETDESVIEVSIIEAGALVIDRSRREVRVAGEVVKLTSKEFDVLDYLAQNVGRICTHQMVLSSAWGSSYVKESQYLHVYINRLRHKVLDGSKLDLESVPGVGYLLRETAL